MARIQNPNLEMLTLAVHQLGEVADEMVFLGGCAAGLLITDSAAPPIRVTRDVDAIVQVFSHADYYQLSQRLRVQGFAEDTSDGAPICRWIAGNLVLDVMPVDARLLGFGNQWYASAADHAQAVQLVSGKSIRMVTAPYFLITKLEAFDGRGAGDYLLSHDIEDIVAVLDGRPSLVEEVKEADSLLVKEISKRFQKLVKDARFVESVSGHLPTDGTSQARVINILNTIKRIAETK